MKIDFEATAKKYGFSYEKPKKKTGKIDFDATAKKYGFSYNNPNSTKPTRVNAQPQEDSLLKRTMNETHKPDVTIMSYEDLKRSALGDLGAVSGVRDTSTPLSRFRDASSSGKVLATIGELENASRSFGAYDELYSRLRQGAYDESRQQYRLTDSQKKTVETALSRLQKEFGGASGNYKNLAKEYEDLFRGMTERGSFAEVAGLSLAEGGASQIRDTAAGVSNILTDAISGGRRTEAYQKLDDYFGKNPSALYSAVKGDPIFTPSIAAETGVRQEDLDAYIETMTTQANRDMIYESAGQNLNRKTAEFVGNSAFDIGRQIPGMLLTSGIPAAESRGLIGSLIEGQGAKQALASALRGNLSTYLTGATSFANAYSEGMHQGDYQWQDFVNAFGQGFVEYFTEGLFGFSDTASYKAIFENPIGTGSTRVIKSIMNWLLTGAEEGLEEVVNAPLSNIVGLATGQNPELAYELGAGSDPYLLNRTTAAKKLFGENGVFKLDEMVQGGLQGFAVGALMGTSGAVSSTYESYMEGRDIASTITDLNRISRQELPVDFRPQELNPATARQEDVDAYVVQLQNAIADYAEQVRDGTVSLQVKPRPIEAGEPAAYARDYNLRFRQTDDGLELQEVKEFPNTIRRSNQMNRDGNMLLDAAYRAYQESNPDSAVTPDEYASEFEIAYEYGRSGADIETTRQSTALRNLSAATIEAAHSAGRQAVEQALRETDTSAQEAAPDIETVKIRNVPKTVREQIVRDYTEAGDEVSAADYAGAAAMAYNYGEAGLRIDDVTAENEGASSELIRKYYDMGAAARSAELERAKIKNASFRAANPKGVAGQVRSITAEESGKYGVGTITRRTFNKRQKAAIQVANSLAKDLGINIVLYESKVGKGGVRQGDNGFYANRTLYLDIESGYNNEQAMLRTLSHEVTHYLEDAAPEQYESLRQFVTDYFYESGELSDLIVREQQLASRNGETLSENEAMLEVVANACETMLRDTEAMRAMLKHNTSLFRTIRGWIDDFAKAVRRAWQGISAYEEAAKSLERSEKALREVSRLWYEALAESAVGSSIMSANGAEATLDAAGIQFDADSESVIMRSRRYAPQNEEEIEKVASALQEKLGVTHAEAVRWIESETTLAATILSLQDEQLDYVPDELYKAIKKNSDYPQGTVDFSNLCRKRTEFTAYFNRLQRSFKNHIFTAEEIETIRQVMIRNNVEVACGLCFVEERRQHLGRIANGFVEDLKNGELKPTVEKLLDKKDSYVPSIDDLITREGLSDLRKTHPSIANAFVRYNNARGMQAGRLIEGAAEYKREILKWNKRAVDRKNSLGGLRIFSFSDFEAPYLIDIVQIIQDCARVGVKMQGYTKVPAFAKAVKDTGLKVNRSHIALGSGVETRNGKRVLVNDPVEGIDFNDPDFFDSSDSPNIGNNIVGISDEHIRLAMEDPYYDQVIPFHTSLSNDILTRKKINHWKNYKNYQTEKIADGFSAEDSKTWKRAEQGVNFYTDVLLAAEQEGKPITNKVEFVERFLEVCRERGVIPRFWNFLNTDADGNFVYTEGYHKLLVDYKLFDRDGNILPQEVVKPVFDDAYNTKILEDYSKGYQKPGADDAVYQDLVRELGLENESVRRSRRDPYAVSDREVLANAYEYVAVNAAEDDALKRYRKNINKLEELEQQLDTINNRLRQQFVPGGERLSRAEVSRLSENKKTIQNQIARQDRVLLNFERSAALKRVLEVAKKTATDKVKAKAREDAKAYRERIRAEREAGAENLREYKAKTRETRKKAEYKARVMDLTRELTSWIVRPDNKRHVPTMLIEPIGKFLESIDLSSKALLAGKSVTQRDSRFRQALYALRDAVSGEGDHKEDVFALDISPEFTDYLRALQGAAEQIAERESGTFVVEQMTGDQLETLYKVLRELRRVVTAANQTLTISQYENVDRLARETMAELEAMGKKKDQAKAVRAVDAFFQWENTTPVYAFDRFGKPGRAVFESLQNAQSQLASDAEEIIDFAEKAYTAKEVREWQRETHEIKRGDETVTVTTVQLMELYNLMRRDQGRSHIEGGSVRFADYKNRRGVNVTDQGGAMSVDEVEAALALLTEQQIKVAEAMQDYATKHGGEWGNEISMRRFGIRSFTEERYWPVRTDKNTLSTAVDAEGNDLYRLLNKSFTKPTTQNANNQIIIGNVFDTFASHMSDMAQYHSFALPILDMLRWINYSESTTNANGQRIDRGVKASMDAALGTAAQDYVVKLLKDINGNKTTNGQSAIAMQMLGRYNRAAVGANLRVALLQPTSVMRARLELSGARLFAGVNSFHYRRGRDEMLKWSGIAKWKDLGFFDVNVSRNLTSLVKRDKGVVDRIVDKSMWLAEKGDRMTWVAIWNACRSEVVKENKLKEGSDEFFREVAKRFENVVYRTQVVDSVLTKSNYMRRDDFVSKTTSSFMSEPTLTYNTLLSVRNRLSDDARKHGKGESWKRNRRYAVRALATYITSQAATSFIQALVAIERDDDDEYLTFLERLREEFGEAMEDNFNMAGSVPLSVLGDIPIFSQLYEGVKRVMAAFGADTYGFEPYSGMFEIFDDLVSVGEIVKDRKEGSSRYTEYAVLYRSLSILSSFVGLPISGATREAISAYNLAAQIYNEYIGQPQGNKLKIVRQYDAGDTDRVKYAYRDGTLDVDASVAALLEDAGMSEKDARKEVLSWVVSGAKAAYLGGTASEEETVAAIAGSGLASESDAQDTVDEWDREGIKKDFDAGLLSEEEAAELLVSDGGYEENDAYWKVKEWAGGEGYSKYNEFYAAVEKGTNLKKVVQTYLDNGVKKETLASQITEHFKPIYVELYKANKASSLMGYLLNAYELLGYKREDKKKDILDWPEQARKKEEEEKKKK